MTRAYPLIKFFFYVVPIYWDLNVVLVFSIILVKILISTYLVFRSKTLNCTLFQVFTLHACKQKFKFLDRKWWKWEAYLKKTSNTILNITSLINIKLAKDYANDKILIIIILKTHSDEGR